MRLVVDASVAVKWLVTEPDSDIARELAAGGDDLHAPRLMTSEIANTLWRKTRSGRDHARRRGRHAGVGAGNAGALGRR